MLKKLSIPGFVLLAPLITHSAQLHDLINDAHDILRALVPFLIGIGLVIFLFGVLRYIAKGGSESDRANARQLMLWGIIILFVMTSVWGLVNVIVTTTDITKGTPPTPLTI